MKVELVKFGEKDEEITTHIEEENIQAVKFTLKNKKSIEIGFEEDFPGCVTLRTTSGRLELRLDCANVVYIKPVNM